MVRLTKEEIISYFQNEIKQYDVLLGGIISDEYRAYIEKIVLCYKAAIVAIEKGENE